jgi:hypothetical protein
MPLSRAAGAAVLVLLTACSASSPPNPKPSVSGAGAPSISSPSGGSSTGGSSSAGSSAGGSQSQGGVSASGGASLSAGSGSGGVSSGGAGGAVSGEAGATGGADSVACGYKGMGHVLDVSAGVSLCIPPQACLPETCPPTVGSCVNDQCVFKPGYQGLQTLPEAWATHYCDLQSGACQGVHQLDTVLATAQAVAQKANLLLCKSSSAGAKCVGIVASPPMMVGNREKFGEIWGLGLTEASGLCYEVTGPGGAALLAITDRCGGFCKCPSLGANDFSECGQCKEAADMTPLCECRGDNNCGTQQCDWCAENNHPHFDLDDDTFNHVCGDQAFKGSCQLTAAKFVPCTEPRADWPPPL